MEPACDEFRAPGLLGVVIAAELAGYMAIANGFMNWGASFLANDIYRGAMHPQATQRQLGIASKIATVTIICYHFWCRFCWWTE